ncbi:4a-hydroxytetrahydrobiopterin dehydratase [Algisphaera agarilytica]|uniref:Putative pterin-4-alpha-carbinolamine dehydratase n=1 Tax=Algisphaera agarilytica TaxID=1385975 RepID=A0A7X0H4T3_9BACT|nr:4a-hydroxytetrahydrobiopterin dehydratase [Algisphaera agarilytica]MBB6429245.1 4a-hydroxytetrahydrobiopterin dehydratase [Algisphaera agarilytica]
MSEPLSLQAIETALQTLPGWSYADDKLGKRFGFADFKAALAFINRVGDAAESANHHPEIFNVYNTVEIKLNTHDADGRVTEKDVQLAGAIEQLA